MRNFAVQQQEYSCTVTFKGEYFEVYQMHLLTLNYSHNSLITETKKNLQMWKYYWFSKNIVNVPYNTTRHRRNFLFVKNGFTFRSICPYRMGPHFFNYPLDTNNKHRETMFLV